MLSVHNTHALISVSSFGSVIYFKHIASLSNHTSTIIPYPYPFKEAYLMALVLQHPTCIKRRGYNYAHFWW